MLCKDSHWIATVEEHQAYVDSVLAKEVSHSINEAEVSALKILQAVCYAQGTLGGLGVRGRLVSDDRGWVIGGDPRDGALFVRASAQSK